MPSGSESETTSPKQVYIQQLVKEGRVTDQETPELRSLIGALEAVKFGFRQSTVSQIEDMDDPKFRNALKKAEELAAQNPDYNPDIKGELDQRRQRHQLFAKAGLGMLVLTGANLAKKGVDSERILQLQELAIDYVLMFPEDVTSRISPPPEAH